MKKLNFKEFFKKIKKPNNLISSEMFLYKKINTYFLFDRINT